MSDYSDDGWGGAPAAIPAKVVAVDSLPNKMANVSVKEAGDGFAAKPGTGGFGGAGAQPAAAPAAANTSSSFGKSEGFGSTNQAAKPAGTGFGAAAPVKSSSGFGSSSQDAKPAAQGFGAPAAPSGFGAPAAASGFGAASKPANENKGFGASNGSAGFGGSDSASKGFGSGSASNGFGSKAPESKGFGASNASTGFGSKAPESKGFGGSENKGFGASNASAGFGSKAPESKGFGAPSGFGGSESKGFGGGSESKGFGGGSSGFGGSESKGFGGGSSGFGGGESKGFGASTGFGGNSGGGGGRGACFNCGGEGHNSRDCTEPRKERAPQKCFNCDQEGHRSMDCTEPKKERRGPMTCYNCQQEGHRSSDCTEPRKERGPRSFGAPGGGGFGGSDNKPSGFGASGGSGFGGASSGFGASQSSGFGNSGAGFGAKPSGFGNSDGGSAFGNPGGAFGGGGDGATGGNGCFHCQSEDHRARDCPSKPAQACFNCKQEGHRSSECPNERVVVEGEEARPPKSTFVPEDTTENDLFENRVEKGDMFDKFFDTETQITGNSGREPPAKIKSFDEVGFTETVASNIARAKYERPTPVQQCAIPIIMGGHDMISVAQTGSGKTAAFLLPVIHHLITSGDFTPSDPVCRPRCIILSPTRELCVQIHNESRKLCTGTVLNTACIYGGTSVEYAKNTISRGASILVATVGRLEHFIKEGLVSTEKVKFFILDEADRMMESDSFGPSVNLMAGAPMPPPGERQTLMFSATFPAELQQIGAEILSKDYVMVTVDSIGCANKCITQEFVACERRGKREELFKLLNIDIDKYSTAKDNEVFKQKTIVFVESKKMADMLGLQICESGIPALTIHGDRMQNQRSEALREFTRGNKAVLVATAVAERGLDIKGVDHVINYDMPDNIDKYVHRIGRTGRVGNAGRATSFYDQEKDSSLSGELVRILEQAGQIVPPFLAADGGAGGFAASGNAGADEEW